jgi:hypothetical protein
MVENFKFSERETKEKHKAKRKIKDLSLSILPLFKKQKI